MNWIKFANPLIKQGNSFCIRLPKLVIDQLKVKKDDLIIVKVSKLKPKLTEEHLEPILKKVKECKKQNKKLRNLGDEKLMIMAVLVFNEFKAMMIPWKNKLPKTKQDKIKQIKLMEKFREKIKKALGEKLFKDYILFRKIFDKWIQSRK